LRLDYNYLEEAVLGIFRLDFSRPVELRDLLGIDDIKNSAHIKRTEKETDTLMKKVGSYKRY